jgi:hypothetical protein
MTQYNPLAKPKLVILDIYSCVFCQSPYESAADLIQNGNSHGAALKMALQLGDIRAVNMLAVGIATCDLPALPATEDSLYNGSREVKDRISNFNTDNCRYQSDKVHTVAFERTIRYLRNQNIPVVLTIPPKSVNYLEESNREFMRDIQPVIEKYNLHVIELCMSGTRLVIADYPDISHLNKHGTKKHSKALPENIFKRTTIARN